MLFPLITLSFVCTERRVLLKLEPQQVDIQDKLITNIYLH